VAAADAVDSVGVHYRRTGHQDYAARYVDGRGLQLHCTSCDTRIHIAQPAKAPESAATTTTINVAGYDVSAAALYAALKRSRRLSRHKWSNV
jgi:hypothetical protein